MSDKTISSRRVEDLWAAQNRKKIYTPRYRKVLTHDISPPLDVMMHLHLALYRGPICKHAAILAFTDMSSHFSSFSHTNNNSWSADTDGAKSSISFAYSNILTRVWRM